MRVFVKSIQMLGIHSLVCFHLKYGTYHSSLSKSKKVKPIKAVFEIHNYLPRDQRASHYHGTKKHHCLTKLSCRMHLVINSFASSSDSLLQFACRPDILNTEYSSCNNVILSIKLLFLYFEKQKRQNKKNWRGLQYRSYIYIQVQNQS